MNLLVLLYKDTKTPIPTSVEWHWYEVAGLIVAVIIGLFIYGYVRETMRKQR